MYHSLLSRLQGAFLGAVVGEQLGASYAQALQRQAWPQGDRWQLRLDLTEWRQNRWLEIAWLGVESLIQRGGFDGHHWQQQIERDFPTDPTQAGFPDCSEVAVATFPLGLFYHEDSRALTQVLPEAAKLWSSAPEFQVAALVMGQAIAQSLQESFNPETVIPKLATTLDASQSTLKAQLLKVQTLLQQRAGIVQARDCLVQPDTEASKVNFPLILALYCFLSQSASFQLSLVHAARLGYRPDITCALTGALSGGRNATIGIPLIWQLALNQTCYPPASADRSGENAATYLSALAGNFLAAWSGIHNPERLSTKLGSMTAIAAPDTIRLLQR